MPPSTPPNTRPIPASNPHALADAACTQRGFERFRQVRLGPLVDANGLRDAELVFAADIACYPPALRVTWPKLVYLCAAFPKGVRLYLGESGGAWHPVGYSAWHPVRPTLLDEPWPDVVTVLEPGEDVRAAYLFNYSVVPSLIGSPLARTVMCELAADIAGIPMLVADTVSEHGRRAAARWGMSLHTRRLVHGEPWELWARRGASPD